MNTGKSQVPVASLMTALLAACVAFQLNASMLSPVLVTMAKALQASEAAVGLSQTAFFTAAALFSLFLPRLGDMLGRRRVLLGMLLVMLAGSVLAALAPSIGVLQLARLVQGVSGPVVPVCLLMLYHEVHEPRRYGLLMGVITAVNGGIAGIDAIAGGWLATQYGFRAVFWCIAVVAALACLLVAWLAPESRPSPQSRMDWPGVSALVFTLGCWLWALQLLAADSSWPAVLGMALAGGLGLLLFLYQEGRSPQPLLALPLLCQRRVWALLLTTVLTMTGVFAIINGLVMSHAQETAGHGLTAEQAAWLLLTPYALIGWLVGPWAGQLAPRVGYGRVLRLGLAGSMLAIVLMLLYGLSSLWWMVAATLLAGVAYAGTANIILNGLGVVLSPADAPGLLPGLNAGAFNLGAGLSFALLPAMAYYTGPAGGMLLGLVMVLLAWLVSLLIPRPGRAELAVVAATAHPTVASS
ncbi:MFS transporter [Aquitalea sp. LB_tupeE]|uniref:uridine transporter UriT n=1 Tax=Aquitalea sp. LB_tupeE TaxID=2748078 RepID=UPI0015B885DE|nr:MFS transporter [Aquitalea sp. LB_tupeE]NWK77952.1 MFS transporter [Aquitalea sp. LB_tupeE]